MRAARLADGAGDIALGQRDEHWPLNAHGSSRRQDERKSLETARAAHVSRLFAVLPKEPLIYREAAHSF